VKKQILLLEVRADDDNPDGAPYWSGHSPHFMTKQVKL